METNQIVTKHRLIEGIDPHYEDKAGVIYCGDCLEIIPRLPSKSIDLVVTSPPFLNANLSHNCKDGGGYRDNHYKQDYDLPEYYDWLHQVLYELMRISEIVMMFNSSRRLNDICRRFNPDRILIWHKTVSQSSFKYEPIFCWGPEKTLNKYIWTDSLGYSPILPRQQCVPFQNPFGLYKRLINFFDPITKIILDPFFGSGTTGVAAKMAGKNFIGIEINPERCGIAKQRLAQEILI